MRLIFALLLPATAFAYQLKTDSTGSTVQWKTSVHFVAQPNFDTAAGTSGSLGALQAATATWSGREGVPEISISEGVTRGLGFDAYGSNQNEVVVLDEWPFDANAIASTVVTIDRTHHTIIDADIAFNRQRNSFGVLPETSSRGGTLDDVQNTMTHELGHALGLAHDPTQPLAVMYPQAFSGEVNKRTLSDDDLAGLTALYGATSTPLTEVPAQTQGCSVIGAGPLMGALLSMLRTRRLNRKLIAALLLVSFAAVSAPRTDKLTVSAATTSTRGGLFVTQLTLSNGQSVKVYGGRIGDYEQLIDGVAVPMVGDEVRS